MSTTNNIKNILLEQIKGYRELLGLLQREKECLIDLDATGIESISKEKDTTILRLRLLEEERINLLKRFSEENGIEGLTLQRLYELTGDESLKGLRLQLISILQSIEELNEFNGILIERSLGFIRGSLEFLKTSGANPRIVETTVSRKV